jgi:hypothetical protein
MDNFLADKNFGIIKSFGWISTGIVTYGNDNSNHNKKILYKAMRVWYNKYVKDNRKAVGWVQQKNISR